MNVILCCIRQCVSWAPIVAGICFHDGLAFVAVSVYCHYSILLSIFNFIVVIQFCFRDSILLSLFNFIVVIQFCFPFAFVQGTRAKLFQLILPLGSKFDASVYYNQISNIMFLVMSNVFILDYHLSYLYYIFSIHKYGSKLDIPWIIYRTDVLLFHES